MNGWPALLIMHHVLAAAAAATGHVHAAHRCCSARRPGAARVVVGLEPGITSVLQDNQAAVLCGVGDMHGIGGGTRAANHGVQG